MDGLTQPNFAIMMPGVRRFLSGGVRTPERRNTSDMHFVEILGCSDRIALVVAEGPGNSAELIYKFDYDYVARLLPVSDNVFYSPDAPLLTITPAHFFIAEGSLHPATPAPIRPVATNVAAPRDVIGGWVARGLFAGPLTPRVSDAVLKPVITSDSGAAFTGKGVVSTEEPRVRLKP